MRIIRDEECFGLMMIPLLVEWGIRRCNVEGCIDKPNTIISQEEVGIYGLCERHYQEANKPGGTKFTLVFDEFDAFGG